MDLHKALRELYQEKKRLDKVIERLEKRLMGALAAKPQNKRGRKSMAPEERLEVSRRMRAYWEARRRRKENGAPDATPGPGSKPG